MERRYTAPLCSTFLLRIQNLVVKPLGFLFYWLVAAARLCGLLAKLLLHSRAIISHSSRVALGNGASHVWSNGGINKSPLDYTLQPCDYLSHFIYLL